MIEIKNKVYYSKERKKQIRFNKYIMFKKKIRLAFQKLLPLSDSEKNIYVDDNIFANDKAETVEKEKFFEFNKRIHILSVIPKDKMDIFYDRYESMIRDNPAEGYSGVILDANFKNLILSYKYKINSNGWINLGYISPKYDELNGVVEYIEMSMFDLSDDYVCLNFIVTIDKKLNNEINQLIISKDVPDEINYYKYKKHITKVYGRDKNLLRKEKIKNILLEIKMRCYDFINLYIELFPINENMPITLDEYSTNYELNKNNNFFRCYDFQFIKEKNIIRNMSVTITKNNSDSSQSFENVDIYWDYGYTNYSLDNSYFDRSGRILININENEKENSFSPHEFISIYRCILNFYLNFELEFYIANKREKLENGFKGKTFNIYSKYVDMNKKINTYKSILGSIIQNSYIDMDSDNALAKSLSYQNKRFLYLINKDKEINEEFSNILMAKSNEAAEDLAFISLVMAVASVILSILALFLGGHHGI